VDDYFWVPTSPPYLRKRDPEARLALMGELFLPRDSWVLSGSVMGWGGGLIEKFDGVVFLTVEPAERMSRLHDREVLRYGEAVGPGGVNEQAHREFLDWARGYDDPDFSGRSLVEHERWLAGLPCPVLRLDSAQPVATLLAAVKDWVRDAVAAPGS
jgi:hypothetical protein